jgi:hypothetical protein
MSDQTPVVSGVEVVYPSGKVVSYTLDKGSEISKRLTAMLNASVRLPER